MYLTIRINRKETSTKDGTMMFPESCYIVDKKEHIGLIDLETLMIEFEDKRKQMIEVGMKFGLSDSKTLKLSQEIDILHNRLMNAKCKGN